MEIYIFYYFLFALRSHKEIRKKVVVVKGRMTNLCFGQPCWRCWQRHARLIEGMLPRPPSAALRAK
jgi:hypothetical protein